MRFLEIQSVARKSLACSLKQIQNNKVSDLYSVQGGISYRNMQTRKRVNKYSDILCNFEKPHNHCPREWRAQ